MSLNFNIVRYGSLALACIGIILFWVFGFNGMLNCAGASFFVAGTLGGVFLICEGIKNPAEGVKLLVTFVALCVTGAIIAYTC